MSAYGLLIFALVYALAVATPGPGIAAVIARGLGRGTHGAPAFIAGFLVGDLIWFTLAALGLAVPDYRHHLLLTNAAGQRLAKRDKSLSLRQMRETGLTPAAVRQLAGENEILQMRSNLSLSST